MKFGILVLDTLRYDTFVEEMESISEYADHQYTQMYTTSRWTVPAHGSLFTGYYPTEVGSHSDNRFFQTKYSTIAELFSQNGYKTIGASNNIYIDSFFNFDRGFEEFHRGPNISHRPIQNKGGINWPELMKNLPESRIRQPIEAIAHILRSDAPKVPSFKTGIELFLSSSESSESEGIEWSFGIFDELSSSDQLFFFANFMTTHYPYDPPEEYCPHEPLYTGPMALTLRDKPVTEKEHKRHWECYRGAAQYLDDTLPDLIEQVEWDLLFIIGDHGELFGEHGIRGHQYGMYDELVHIPALALGELVEPGTTTSVTSLLDVYYTVLEAAGIPPQSAYGVNLLEDDLPADRAVYAESTGCEWYSPEASGLSSKVPASWNEPHYMLRTNEAMLIDDKDGVRVIDPDSKKRLPEYRTALKNRTELLRDNLQKTGEESGSKSVSEDVQERLEQLGYK